MPTENSPLPAAAAQLPPNLPEWDPRWSRLVTVGEHTFHVLDTADALRDIGAEPAGTIVAVHGNPTWSYMWRRLAQASIDLAQAGGTAWRIIAPDHLDMGYSERVAHPVPTPHGTGYFRLADRINQLDALISELVDDSLPLVTLGHDWGGVISLGWAARNTDRISAAMSLNTAVHQPEDASIPAPLRAALAGPLLAGSTVYTDAFIRTTLRLSKDVSDPLRRAYRRPYASAQRRGGVGGFVADIAVDENHPSHAELQRVGADIARMTNPALLMWGPKDPVFLERYLRDLRERLPQADIHRFEKTSHLFVEDVPYWETIFQWLDANVSGQNEGPSTSAEESGPAQQEGPEPDFVFSALDAKRHERSIASVDMSAKPAQAVSWAQLAGVVDNIAAGLKAMGLRKGDRVSLLIEPGNNLTAAAYAVLKVGGVVVVADAGLGPAGMTRAVKAADPQWIIGETPGLTLARAGGWPGRRISVLPLPKLRARALKVETSITALSRTVVRDRDAIAVPELDDDAAILFTSGSTGPAKGVRYTHRGLGELMRILGAEFDVRPGTGLVAGFAPFALLGPGLGAVSVTPNMSVTKPATLTASALADAIIEAGCTMVFASPAAYTNVVKTAGALSDEQREACGGIELALSAGAPVPTVLMEQIAEVFPNAQINSPYGMTESLLLTNIDFPGAVEAEADAADPESSVVGGVCVGRPIGPVDFKLAPLDAEGKPSEHTIALEDGIGVLSEFVVSAAHLKDGYDRLWKTDADARRDEHGGAKAWHRTGDIGRFDAKGRLWLEGRVQHVIAGPAGPIGPGAVESIAERTDGVTRCAAVGVGPVGTQALVVVLEPGGPQDLQPGLAPQPIIDDIRAAVLDRMGLDVAAVLVAPEFPTDIRHNSKVGRSALGAWASRVLSGAPVGRSV